MNEELKAFLNGFLKERERLILELSNTNPMDSDVRMRLEAQLMSVNNEVSQLLMKI